MRRSKQCNLPVPLSSIAIIFNIAIAVDTRCVFALYKVSKVHNCMQIKSKEACDLDFEDTCLHPKYRSLVVHTFRVQS